MSERLARRLCPPVVRRMWASKKGVTAFPETRCARASSRAMSRAACITSRSTASDSATGCARTMAPGSFSERCASTRAAASSGDSTRASRDNPLVTSVNAARSPVRYPTTGTPRVSSASRVAGRSRIDLNPEQTTSDPSLRASSSRSVETSKVVAASRWTPPSPPVAITPSPHERAIQSVAETVVAASSPRATAIPRSRRPALRRSRERAIRSRSSADRPTRIRPPMIAIVAGTAPDCRTASSASRAVSRLSGQGKPCVTRVDSSATTPRPSARASATSPAISHAMVISSLS